jgi:hypothetical protein
VYVDVIEFIRNAVIRERDAKMLKRAYEVMADTTMPYLVCSDIVSTGSRLFENCISFNCPLMFLSIILT